ncbi:MAG: lysylphosphatidylglycerol synthase transmembrane domain-containing protein [Pseudomonadota bacterium]
MRLAATASKMPTPGFVVRIAITLAIFAVLLQAVSGLQILEVIANASFFWLAAAVAALIVQTVLSALRWRITAAQLGQHLPLDYAIKEYFLSQAFNQALPGAVVGDAARAVRASHDAGLLVASQAVFFERFAGQMGMFLTMAISFILTSMVAGGIEWPHSVSTTLMTVTAIGALGIMGIVWLETMPADWSNTMRQWMKPLLIAVFAKKVLPAQILLGAAITFCNLAAFAFAARAVGVELNPVEIAALVPALLFAMLIPVTISGWGMREGVAALILPIAGIGATDAVAASVMFGLAMLVSVMPGAMMVLGRR